jgi:phospholipid-binding lipoprotein MlaA
LDERRDDGVRGIPLRCAGRASLQSAALRALAVAVVALQAAACSSLGSEMATFPGAPGAAPEALALAPSIDPQNDASGLVGAGPDGARVSQLYAPSSTGAAPAGGGTAIQGVQVIEEAPPQIAYDISYVDPGDPLEGFNRRVFHATNTIDEVVIEPVARTYRHLFPYPARVAVRNFASNLESPVTLANDVMQGEWHRAHVTFTRFVINSTIGFAGFHDVAATMGYEGHREDFDQTLALYGWSSGPYIVVPLIGPSTPRHLVGRVIDSLFHPLTWILSGEPYGVVLAERAATGIVAREEVLDTVEATRSTSIDYYSAIQSFYRQNRASEINNGRLVDPGEPGDEPNGGVDLDADLDMQF